MKFAYHPTLWEQRGKRNGSAEQAHLYCCTPIKKSTDQQPNRRRALSITAVSGTQASCASSHLVCSNQILTLPPHLPQTALTVRVRCKLPAAPFSLTRAAWFGFAQSSSSEDPMGGDRSPRAPFLDTGYTSALAEVQVASIAIAIRIQYTMLCYQGQASVLLIVNRPEATAVCAECFIAVSQANATAGTWCFAKTNDAAYDRTLRKTSTTCRILAGLTFL